MANNANVNKVVYGGETLIDLTGDTVEASSLLSGITAHDKSGAVITGSCSYDSDTTDATASASEILKTKTAYVAGSKVTGSMTNNGAVTGTISTKAGQYTIPQGYHDGAGKVSIAAAEQAKLIATNIRSGVTILGVAGSMSSTEGLNSQSKTVTPGKTSQTVVPDEGYNALASVTVNAISYTETDNASGGKTVTIAGA